MADGIGRKPAFFLVIVLFAVSLRQTSCRFCHNIRDYASDEKEEKIRTREMIAMVQYVNPRNWSEKRITCYTCHAGEEQGAEHMLKPGHRPAHEHRPHHENE